MIDNDCALNYDATESLSLSQMCQKQADDGRLVDITSFTCIPTTCCDEIFHNLEIAHVTLTTPT